MNLHPRPSLRLWVACVLALPLLSQGCGKGGEGGGASVAARTGSVTVLVTDGPIAQLDHVFIDITRVSLLPEGDGEPVVVFDGSERIDLLAFRDQDFLLAADDDVRAGTYEKIRLEIAEVEVEPGSECAEVKLPSGKIDLNPRGSFQVSDEAPIFVRLDIDARKSVSIHQTGQGNRCSFRPVVFIDVRAGEVEEECPQEVAGTIVEIHRGGDLDDEDDEDGEGAGGGDADPGEEELAELVVDLGGDRGRVRVEIESRTAIFDAQAQAASVDGLAVGDRVLVRGELEGDAEIEAAWVMEGEPADLRGTFESAVIEGEFSFLAGAPVECRTTAGTLVFAECSDDPLPLSAIAAGQSGRVIGARVMEGEATFLRAAVVDLGPAKVRGEIVDIEPETMEIHLRQADAAVLEVNLDASTEIVLVGDGSLEFGDLRVGQTVTAHIEAGDDHAVLVEVEPEEASGVVELLDLEARTFVLTVPSPAPETPALETQVAVAAGATVLLIQGDDASQVALGELKDGDRVTVFGSIPVAGAFEARTVVIRR